MWMVHEILHSMFESKEVRLCWVIHVAYEAGGDILKIIVSLDSDMHESNKSVIEVSSMLFLNFSALLQWDV